MINFSDKKITLMGLGVLGRGLGDAEFLAEEGADLIVTDLKSQKELAESLIRLKKFKNIKFRLGGHKLEDFKNRDMILRGPIVPYDSRFLKIAKANKIKIEMDDSLFAKHCPCPIVGITGTRGKTTTAVLIFKILSENFRKGEVYLAGNIQGAVTLPLLRKVKANDLVILELSSWQLQGWNEAHISPHISIITNIYPDHLNYYKGKMQAYIADKKSIYLFQTKNDYLILNQNNKYSKEFAAETKSEVIWFSKNDLPKSWKIKLIGEHNLENIAAAMAAAKLLKVSESQIKKVVELFRGIEHRLELVKEIGGVKYINDTTSTTPIATQKALNSFSQPVILIAGGSDKGLDFKDLALDIKNKCKAVVLLKGSGTKRLKSQMLDVRCQMPIFEHLVLLAAIKRARSLTEHGDVILFSPACASFEMFTNEYDRGNKFKDLVKRLK